MTWRGVQFLLLAGITAAVGAPLLAQTTTQSALASLASISSNDNRTPAGNLNAGVLTLSLDIRKGIWHPEADTSEGIAVYSFGETGKPLQDPGPTIRVVQGTTIDVTLHNQLAVPVTIQGLHQHPGSDKDVITVAAGATQNVRFLAGAPGTYLYQGRTPDGSRGANRALDSQLGGAFVVDAVGASTQDRIFVTERWNGTARTAINGKSWPYTEKLTYKVGENVHWRIVNASDQNHPMHLHGGEFQLDAVGDGEQYKVFQAGFQPMEFTHSIDPGTTFDMSWTPSEPGRWLFHCHRLAHMRLPIDLDPADPDAIGIVSHAHVHDTSSDYAGMGGMILGITVTGPAKIDTTAPSWKPERQLQLTIAAQAAGPQFYQLSLADLAPAAAKDKPLQSTGLLGPVMVLNQNQPVEISIVNKLKEPTTIHWHGMELESYYDGVPAWSGIGDKQAPAVEPGKSFAVRMVPPHAGTFMYHTHWHDGVQINDGVAGMLVVMPAGEKYNPDTDKAFLATQSGNDPFGTGLILVNGQPQLPMMALKTGTTYRLRFGNLTPGVNNLHFSLSQAGTPVQWRSVGKDAYGVAGTPMQVADQIVAIGETYDFEYRATSPQTLTLEAVNPANNARVAETLVFANP